MRIPATYVELMKKWNIPGEEAFQPQPASPVIYPPAGFLAWPFGDLGNGDDYGYYWPLGKEDEEPVVALMSHDCWGLNPVASSIEALVRMGICRQVNSLFAGGNPDQDEDDGPESQTIAERLVMDDRSPFLLVANADTAMARGDLDQAENLYLRAVEMLPEYTAAHYGLVMLCRRQRKTEQAIRWMLEAIRSSVAFRGASFWAETYLPTETVNRNDYRRKCLLWLQQTRPEQAGPFADDPLFQALHRLTFATGVKTNDDFLVFEEVIDAYLKKKMMLEAIRLATVSGELMMCETSSFRERYGFTQEKHRDRLLELFRAGGYDARCEFLTKRGRTLC